MYNLRKKIAQYYENEGKEDIFRLSIDKGQYEVRFFNQQKEKTGFQQLNWSKILPYPLLILAIAILIINNLPKTKPALWKPFLASEKSINLFIGDHFGLTGTSITGNLGWTRDFSVNSLNDFYQLIHEKPELSKTLRPSNYSYSTRMGALATQYFQQLFQTYNKDLAVRFSTQTSTSEIKEGNAIYVGPVKNKNPFIELFNEGNPYFTIGNDSLRFEKHPTLKNSSYKIRNLIVNEEYAIVSKYRNNETEHFVFFSDHDIGVIATTEYFTNKDSIQKFEELYLDNNKHFTAIFKVKGQDRTNTNLKIEKVVSF